MQRGSATAALGRDTQNGMTFVEVLAALLILSVAMSGFGTMASAITSGNTRSRDEAAATALAVAKAEELKGQAFNGLASGSDGPFAADGSAGAMFSRRWIVSGEYLVAAVPSKNVTVAVDWRGGGNVVLATRVVSSNLTSPGTPRVFVTSWDQIR